MYSDVSIAGDPLALPHLLPPVPQHPATLAEFAGLARTVAADRARWAPLVRYDATTRWYARLRTGPGYEVWLLSWLPGQTSGLHDHGRSSGVLTVLQGALRERALTTRALTATARPAASGSAPARPAAPGPATARPAGALSAAAPSAHGGTPRAETTRVLTEGHQRAFAPGYVHEVVNDGLEPAVSLHVYFPGLTDMTPHARVPAAEGAHAPEGAAAV